MPAAANTTRVRLRDPSSLVAAVPHLLGFTPADSLVAVGLRQPRSQVCLTVRVDLAVAAEPGVASHVVGQLRRAGAEEVVFVLFGTSEAPPTADEGTRRGDPPLPYRTVVDAVGTACRVRSLVVRDLLWTEHGRWWSYVCADVSCCPAEGTPVDPRTVDHLAAELAVSGRAALPDRKALEASVAPQLTLGEAVALRSFQAAVTPVFGDADIAVATDDRDSFLASAEVAVRAAVERCAPGGPALPPDECARVTALLTFPSLLASALQWLDGDRHDAAEALWLQLTRSAPPPWGAAPATLLGLYAYARGDGARARVSADRALADRPGDALAWAVHEMLDRGIPPEEVGPIAGVLARHVAGPACP
jgi:hypothetical protein